MTLSVPPPPSAGTAPSVGSIPVTTFVHEECGRTAIALRGEADSACRPALSKVLSEVIASGDGDVVVDLAETTFIDTAIVGTLATGQQLLDRRGRIMTFRSPSRLATLVLQTLGLTDLIETRESIRP